MNEVWFGRDAGASDAAETVAGTTYGFNLGHRTVTETVHNARSSTTIVYSVEADRTLPVTAAGGGDNAYVMASSITTFTDPTAPHDDGAVVTYAFSGTASQVTVTEVVTRGNRTRQSLVTANPSSVFTGLNTPGAPVTETYAAGNAVITVTYVNTGTGYVIQSVAAVFIPPHSAVTALDVNPYNRARFTVDAGKVVAVQQLSPKGTPGPVQSATADRHIAFVGLGPSSILPGSDFVAETVDYGTHSAFEVFFSPTPGGVYTEVAHGTGVASAETVDMSGLAKQLAAVPQAVLQLM